MATGYRPRSAKRVAYEAGPFTGMRDSLDPTSTLPNKATLLQNVYPVDPARASAVVGRPGCQQLGSQLGTAGVRTAQLIHQFTKLSGTEFTIIICGGKLYTVNWTTRVIAEAVNAATFTAAVITLSTTARCRAVTVADKVLISDGVNTPFLWDGTTNGGLTKLSNSPVIYGKPTVYYAKVFDVKNTERRTIVWSEENDATTGYEAGGYNNAWTLGQTNQEALYGVIGTNEALYYFRARSIGAVSGAVTTDFRTTGTREAVSETSGTTSPDSLVYHERRVFYLDADLRPHVVIPGEGAVPIWEDAAETVALLDRDYAASALGFYDPTTKLVFFGVVGPGSTVPSMLLVYNPGTSVPEFVGVWRGFSFNAAAVVKNLDGNPVLLHIDENGYAYDHGTPTGTLWSDALNAGTAPIEHVVQPGYMGYDVEAAKTFDELNTNVRTTTTLTNVRIDYQTPRGPSTTQTTTLSSSTSRWDYMTWGTSLWTGSSLDQHLAVGLNAVDVRWIRPRFLHSASGEQFGLTKLRVSGRLTNDTPGLP